MDSILSVQYQNFSENRKELTKVLGSETKTDNSKQFGKACEDRSRNHCTSTPHRSETKGIAERAVRKIKEGTAAELLRSGLDEKWWAGIPWNVAAICEIYKIYCLMGKHLTNSDSATHSKDQ